MDEEAASIARQKMVREQLQGRDIRDPAILNAMGRVPRHRFLDAPLADQAYQDHPLAIGSGQTISQPYIVALMLQAASLRPEDRLLEIGTGSGYAAAVAAECVKEVVTIERHLELATEAKKRLFDFGYQNVSVVVGDGSLGYAEGAPYDAIICTCAAPAVPPALLDQLAPGGRMILPIGDLPAQQLVRVTREGSGFREEPLLAVRFVPLVGEQGF